VPDIDPAVAKHAERIHQALQALGLADDDRRCLLTGFVAVCEWIDPATGKRWLSYPASPTLEWWQRDGLLQAALDGDWTGEQETD
jgi:hypothetical protein